MLLLLLSLVSLVQLSATPYTAAHWVQSYLNSIFKKKKHKERKDLCCQNCWVVYL